MIYAELQYEQHYSEVHEHLVSLLRSSFSTLDSGLQGDSWIWVYEGNEKVEIDTFSSMHHQIKSAMPNGRLVQKVIRAVSTQYQMKIYSTPEAEAHE